jgi:hypothetical protein
MSKNGNKFSLDCAFKVNRQNVFFSMRIPDADPGDQNHADPCGCGSVTLPDTLLSLLESYAWRCGTRVHVYSNPVAQVGGFSFIIAVCTYVCI